jgi:hypothetical protein
MMKLPSIIVFALLLMVCSTAVWGQKTSKKYDSVEYDALVAKLNGGASGVDFKALRIAFTRTKGYSPYGH